MRHNPKFVIKATYDTYIDTKRIEKSIVVLTNRDYSAEEIDRLLIDVFNIYKTHLWAYTNYEINRDKPRIQKVIDDADSLYMETSFHYLKKYKNFKLK